MLEYHFQAPLSSSLNYSTKGDLVIEDRCNASRFYTHEWNLEAVDKRERWSDIGYDNSPVPNTTFRMI